MTYKELLSPQVCECFEDMGLDLDNILASTVCDIDKNYIFTDVYLACDKENLYIVSGNRSFISSGKVHSRFVKPKEEFHIYSKEKYPLSALKDIRETDFQSIGIIEACLDTEATILAMYTKSRKRQVRSFLSALRKIAKGHFEPEKEMLREDICPKCKCRYPDPEKKVCPNCLDNTKILSRLFAFFSKYKGYMFIAIASLVFVTAFTTITPYISGKMFLDEVLTAGGKWYGQVLFVIIIMVATKLAGVLSNIINGIVTAKIAARVVYDLKKTTFDAITKLSMSFFSARQTGGLMTSVNNDANTIYTFLCDHLPYLLIYTVQFIALFVLMLITSPFLTLLSFITVPLYFFCSRFVFSLFKKLYARNFTYHRSFNAIISDILSGIRVVKVFAKEDWESKRFEKTNIRMADSNITIGKLNSTFFPAINYALTFGTFLAWIVGGWQIISNPESFTLGALTTFIGYQSMLYAKIHFFGEVSRWWAESINATSRVFEILDSIPDVTEKENATELEGICEKIEFKNVSFSYDKSRNTLEDISFELEKGKVLGIAGETGAGKSTLVNLLIRLYDTSSGSILIDGQDVRDISFSSLHKTFAIVSQETFLFKGTIYENIAYAKPDATREEVLAAAKIADAHRFIIKYPDGYNTQVGWGNKELSGGERQRISIARAILKDPQILILDEATAAMDTETERRIWEAIEALSKNRTTIIIAHRLSTLRNADKLLVINDGKAAEYGTHSELIAKRGIYFNLYKLQYEALKTIGIT